MKKKNVREERALAICLFFGAAKNSGLPDGGIDTAGSGLAPPGKELGSDGSAGFCRQNR
ncbi:MAG TPA: hypothetical protein VLT37_03745 [Acidocella sp.]|nr:hypothetical protein [Acidocella sp.]